MEKKITIGVLVLLCILAIAITIWTIWFRQPDSPMPPDYPPAETEDHQRPIEGDTGNKLDSPAGGGAVNLTYATEAKIDLSERKISLYMANPSRSNQDMVVQMTVNGILIFQTDRLTPGHQLTELPLDDDILTKLSIGGYDAMYTIAYYNPKTGEKAIVETEVPNIRLTVAE